ncbi:GLPGLI family protein [Maribacter sp. 2307ULW6-5]|uniref:GLPGLI family protein n=1 Tax=Maribacter sp. 2307ULW6-5 TaxID=3386275 RepID=UPI0039BC74C6
MSPKILKLVFLTVLATQPILSQTNYRIHYQLNFQIDSTNSKITDSDIMYLDVYGNQSSFFQSKSTFLKDSILRSKNPQSLFSITKPKFNYCIRKDYGTDKLEAYYDYTTFKFKLIDNVRLNWKITNDTTKDILGYKVKKASVSFKGRDYTAWFTDEISIPDGPYKFNGLPGLILEIYDSEKHYHFTAFSLQKIKEHKWYIVTEDYTSITEKEFNDFQEKIKKKPSLILNNPGIRIPKQGLDKYDRNHKERNKHKNNPIEINHL